MILKPKQKLDELLEAEFAAEYDALAEQEVQQKISPYRTDEDISYKLDIPRDVAGLVELLEEKKELAGKTNEIKDELYPDSAGLSTLVGVTVGTIPLAILIYRTAYTTHTLDNIPTDLGILTGSLVLMFFGFAGGMLTTAYYLENKSSGRKKFDQKKSQTLRELQEKIQPLDEKLSHYETKYSTGNILFLDDKELGYCLGDVVVEKEERVLRQRYVNGTPDKGYRSYTRTKEINNEEIISVLMPDRELSVDDLLALGTNTPVLWEGRNYGFFKRIDQEDKCVISTQKGLYLPSRQDSYAFQQIESGEITPRILVPEIKSRIKLGS
ncbi:MAG: hypothetical protein AABX24_05020 [Nanoarchaeota archaeon]